MELVFVRHAQPAWFVGGRAVGDPGLTDLGHGQAAEAARRLAADRPYDELLVSPLPRARETAAPIAQATGLAPEVVDDLQEITADDWTGIPSEEVERMFASDRDRPLEEWWNGFPGGESFHEFHDRIGRAIDRILRDRGLARRPGTHLWDLERDPGRILIVAHGGTDAVALGHLLGLEPTPWEWERFRSPHASISRVADTRLAGARIMTLTAFADVAHLSEVTY